MRINIFGIFYGVLIGLYFRDSFGHVDFFKQNYTCTLQPDGRGVLISYLLEGFLYRSTNFSGQGFIIESWSNFTGS